MSYTAKTSGAKLYIGAASGDSLPAPGSDTFTQVTQLRTIAPPPITQNPSSFYILDTTTAQSNGSPTGDRDWTGFIYRDKAVAPHNTLKADAKVAGGVRRNYRVDSPDGIRSDFVGFCTNWAEEPYEASGDAVPPHGVDITIRQVGEVTESTVP